MHEIVGPDVATIECLYRHRTRQVTFAAHRLLMSVSDLTKQGQEALNPAVDGHAINREAALG